MWRLAAAIVTAGATATGVRTAATTTATAVAVALLAADPDQDDDNDDPPPIVFAKDRVGRAHKEFPPIKDFTSYYGGIPQVVPIYSNDFCAHAVAMQSKHLHAHRTVFTRLPFYIYRKSIYAMRRP